MTVARQTWIAGRIDRRRESQQTRDGRAARLNALETRATAALAREIAETPAANRPEYLDALAVALRRQMVALQGPTPAASFLGKQSYEAGRGILPGKIKHAAAEQAWDRLTRAANDRGRS